MINTYVYWIHLPEHTDKMTQGYIGITTDIKRRWRDHKSTNSKSHILKNAIAKYHDSLVWEIIHENIMYEDAARYEATYRPSDHIGWNIKEGGSNSLLPQSVKDKISKAHREKVLTEEHRSNISKNCTFKQSPETRYTGKGVHLTETHKESISDSKLGVAQPYNAGAKNGRFKPWYFITPEGVKHEFTETPTAEYERKHQLNEGEIRTRLKTANKDRVCKAGKYAGYLFGHLK